MTKISEICDKMAPRASKSDNSDLILNGFDPKNTFPTSIRARSHTIESHLKLFLKIPQTTLAFEGFLLGLYRSTCVFPDFPSWNSEVAAVAAWVPKGT